MNDEMSDDAAIETRSMDFDEIAAMCRNAAVARGYPPELAEAAGEMVVWLERHRIPGVAAMALLVQQMQAFDPEAARPETMESGELRFPDPFTGGMFILGNFDRLKFPARINGPVHGALLMTPFLALAAHQRGKGIRISYLDPAGNIAGAQVSYADGKSGFAGEPKAVGFATRIGVEFPVELKAELRTPRDGPVEIDVNFCRVLGTGGQHLH
ncbi:MAG: DUF3726 domain-containing protein [Rhizobiaceae bacterium]